MVQFLSAGDVLTSPKSTKVAARQTHNHRRHAENPVHLAGLPSLVANPSPELDRQLNRQLGRELLNLLRSNKSGRLDAKSNVHQLSQFDNPLLNQLRKQQNLRPNKQPNELHHQPKRSLVRTKKIGSFRNRTVDGAPSKNSQVPLETPVEPSKEATTVKSTFKIFPFPAKTNPSRNRTEDDPLPDSSLDNVLKKSVDDHVFVSGPYQNFAETPENKFYTFCREFRERFLSVHGYLSLSVCVFGIIANILNIIVLTRWVRSNGFMLFFQDGCCRSSIRLF